MRHVCALALVVGCGRIGFPAIDPATGADDDDDGGMRDTGTAGPDADLSKVSVAFVTRSTHSPVFGSLAAADQICRDEAIAGGFDGTFIAYLSTSSVSVFSRLAGSRGWVRTDGKPIADTPAELLAGRMFDALHLDIDREPILWLQPEIWTGTDAAGNPAATCADWTSASASADGTYGNAYSTDPASPTLACAPATRPLGSTASRSERRWRCLRTSRSERGSLSSRRRSA